MRKESTLGAVALSIGMVLAAGADVVHAGGAGLIFHDDRAAFEAQFPGLPCEDFEAGNVGDGGVISCPAPWSSTTDNSCFAPGGLRAGVSFQDDPLNESGGGHPNGLVLIGAGWDGNPSRQIFANVSGDGFEIRFEPPVRFVGMDLVSHFSAGSVDIEIFDPADAEIGGGLNRSATQAGFFFGVSAEPALEISRIRLHSSTDLAEGVDNLCFARLEPGGPIFADDFEGGDFVWSNAVGLAGDIGVFVSSTKVTGDFGGLAFADATCQSLGTAAIPGSGPWVAWLSNSTTDARDRVPRPGPGRAYVRASSTAVFVGEAPRYRIADNLADLTDGSLRQSVRDYDENGNLGSFQPWTGSDADGTVAAMTCQNWTVSNNFDSGATGSVLALDFAWTTGFDAACEGSLPFYCFGALPPRDVGVFVSSWTFPGNYGDNGFGWQSSFDSACNSLGGGAMAGSGPWVAWVSGSDADARDRIPLPGYGRAFVRASNPGVVLAHNLTDLTDGSLDVEVGNFDESGLPLPPPGSPWTGTAADGTVGASTCNDWTSNSNGVGGIVGNRYFADLTWTDEFGSACDQAANLYCFGTLRPSPD